MKCSQCATELPDTATSCPRCGAETIRRPASAFSYLPAGAPPWPTSVPEHLPYVVNAAPSTQASASSVAVASPAATRSAGGILSIILVLVLVPVIGAALTLGNLYFSGHFNRSDSNSNATVVPSHSSNPTAAATPDTSTQSLPAPSAFKTATDNTIHISVNYPSDWTAGPLNQDNSSFYTYPLQAPQKNGIEMFIEEFSTDTTSSLNNPDQLNQINIQTVNQQPGVTNPQSTTSTNLQQPIANEQWKQQEETLTINTIKLHYITLSVQHKQTYYSIEIYIPDVYYQQAIQQYIQPMLSSLKFLA